MLLDRAQVSLEKSKTYVQFVGTKFGNRGNLLAVTMEVNTPVDFFSNLVNKKELKYNTLSHIPHKTMVLGNVIIEH